LSHRNASVSLGSAAQRAVCLVGFDRDSQPLSVRESSVLPGKVKNCLSVYKE
jgi:hypothetical protein